MGLEELTFDVEGVKLYVKPELHLYREYAEDEPFLGSVPVKVHYKVTERDRNSGTMVTETAVKEGHLTYDTGKRIFITALSDFVPTPPNNIELLEKYGRRMLQVAGTYSAMLNTLNPVTKKSLITERNFYQNSQGEWKDIGEWLGVYRDEELRAMADEAE